MGCRFLWVFCVGVVVAGGLVGFAGRGAARQGKDKASPHPSKADIADCDCQLPNPGWKMPFQDEQPITFVARGQSPAEWDALKGFWNETTEKAIDPVTGQPVVRKAVQIKVPLGLNSPPPVPPENPMTVQKWKLGKQIYFDPILSSDRTVSCATCHDPKKGWTDQSPVSTGIRGNKGGVSAPTVLNAAYHFRQFWDGRAASLEDQSQGPPQNPLEMFDGTGHAWVKAVQRLRAEPETVRQFKAVFGTLPTRDAAAKAIAAFERTVLTGNSIHDRAELAMRKRVEAEETGKYELQARDYQAALNDAFARRDTNALAALKLDAAKDRAKAAETARSLVNGRNLFFGKARCNGCHVGDNFTDNEFHNLGVGATKDGRIPDTALGRFAALPTGHKNPGMVGAFKTPTLRQLLSTAPYMHDGSEKTLEQVVDFYDRGGNVNEFLDVRMRDEEAERAWAKARAEGKKYAGAVAVSVFNGKPVAPMKLNLTPREKQDLVLFLRALQGDPADPVVASR